MANLLRVTRALDGAPTTPYRIQAIVLCVLIAIVDGFDFVAFGVVGPLLTKELGLTAAQFGLVLATTQIGAAFGALALGRAADFFGRKPIIVVSLFLIALFTFLTPLTKDYGTLLLVRFMVGVALTGTLPAILALGSELAQPKYRVTITALIVGGFPMGAAIGSLAGAKLVAAAGWPALFWCGAIFALLIGFVVWWRLPESPSFLASNDHNGSQMPRYLPKLVPGIALDRLWEPLPNTTRASDAIAGSTSFGALFRGDLTRETGLLWTVLFCSGVLSNVTIAWLPTIFTNAGMDLGSAARVVGVLNIGATLGMILAGRILEVTGPRLTIGAAFGLAAIGVIALGYLFESGGLLPLSAALGFFLGITTSAGYALSAIIYPVSVRSTGVGAGAAALRIGTVVAPLVVPFVLGLALPIVGIMAILASVPGIAAIVATMFKKGAAQAAKI